ncbi:unnamed protein product [Lactuca virosa]|uniref:Zinc finger GRF-type domain-containing protein n=1 Tax=Lactuca virosa TaxID=75947 RepID=A0AAU9PP45_9ASTR|nr:unnamed protein product [Lactuca virosa]
MASSSTGSMTSGFQNVNVNFRNRNNPMVLCRYGVEASFSISWTDKNPGRKFRGCTNYKILPGIVSSSCGWTHLCLVKITKT